MRLWPTLFLWCCLRTGAHAQTSAATPTPTPTPASPGPAAAAAATPADSSTAIERATYDAAIRDFSVGLYARAARSFAAFEFGFPDSPLKPDAILRRTFAEAASETNAVASGRGLAAFALRYPKSTLALNAVVRSAQLSLQSDDPEAALRLLDPTAEALAGPIAAQDRPTELVAAMQLRAEAALRLNQPAQAIQALQLSEAWIRLVPPEIAYERWRYLLRAHLAAGDSAAAVTVAEQLRSLTETAPNNVHRAEAISLLGGALLRAGNKARALVVFTDNLAPGTPLPQFREATLQIAESDRRAGRLAAARTRLESFLTTQPTDPQLDGIRWSLAQSIFAEYEVTRTAGTNDPNLLALVESQLGAALTNNSPDLRGDLQLLQGWCLWEGSGDTNRLARAADAFSEAASLLPKTVPQAVAYFKLGDVRLRLGQPAAALTNYLQVAEGYPGIREVEGNYATLAWRQSVVAAIAITNFPVAQRAIEQLIARDPRAEATAQGLLSLNEVYANHGAPLRGRELLVKFVSRFPDSPMRPELELSIADALRRERQWTSALTAYDLWLKANPSQTNRARAEFGKALVLANSGGTTNAVELFLQLANQHPGNPLAQTSLMWLGDYYFGQDKFGQAEQAYTSVLTNRVWKGLDPAIQAQARLSAAQAAIGWKQFGRARERLNELLNDKSTPEEFLPEAYFSLGRSFQQTPVADTNSPLAAISDALDAFKAVTTYPDSALGPDAWLEMAECHRQLAAKTPASFVIAKELYQRALDRKLKIEPLVRARATMGLGQLALQAAKGRPAAEATALEDEALHHFLDIAMGQITAITGPLEASVLKDAGYEAGYILEARGLAEDADNLYQRLASELPGMRAYWEGRRKRLKRNAPRNLQ